MVFFFFLIGIRLKVLGIWFFMSCRYIFIFIVRFVICWESLVGARKSFGFVRFFILSTMFRGWLSWSAWSGLRRCCSLRRTFIFLLLEKDENLLDSKWYLAWYIMFDFVLVGFNFDYFYKRRIGIGRSVR